MINPNYIAAKALLNLLPNEEKIKLCKEILDGTNSKKFNKKKRVEYYKNWLENK